MNEISEETPLKMKTPMESELGVYPNGGSPLEYFHQLKRSFQFQTAVMLVLLRYTRTRTEFNVRAKRMMVILKRNEENRRMS